MAKPTKPVRDESANVVVKFGDQPRHEGRRNFGAYLKVGGKGIGKTTDCLDDISEYLAEFEPEIEKPMSPRVLIQDYSGAFYGIMTIEEWILVYEKKIGKKLKYNHPMEMLGWTDREGYPVWKGGVLRYVSSDDDDVRYFHDMVFKYLRNAKVFFDECTVYFDPALSKWQLKLLFNHRNKGLEIVYVFHEIISIPLKMTRCDSLKEIKIFVTGEPTDLEYKKKLTGRSSIIDKLWDAHVKVNAMPTRVDDQGRPTRTQNSVTVVRW